MKTVLTENIDGFEIVVGFGLPVVDPVETNKIIPALLAGTIEENRIVAHRQSIEARTKLTGQTLEAAKAANKRGDEEKVKTLNLEYKMHMSALESLMEGVKPLFEALDKKRAELTDKNAVYFGAASGEIIMEDSEAISLGEKADLLSDNELLLASGEVVPNFKGCEYWTKTAGAWAKSQVLSIGELCPAGSFLNADLTELQKEEIAIQVESERVGLLSPADKLAEFDSAKSRVSAESTALKNQLEFDSDPDFVSKSQAFYDLAVSELKTKYGY